MRQGGSYVVQKDGTLKREEYTEAHPEGGARDEKGEALDQAQPVDEEGGSKPAGRARRTPSAEPQAEG